MNKNKVSILGVNISQTSMLNALDTIKNFLNEEGNHVVYTPNSEMIMASKKDVELMNILNQSDLSVADGAGVVIASKILGDPVPERVAGFDLINMMFKSNAFKDVGFFLLGSQDNVLSKACENLKSNFNIKILGKHNGFFSEEETENIISAINSSGAKILLVGLGSPKQEKWIAHNKLKLNVKVCMGIGGCFDVFAGNVKRAPVFFQKNHLEWLYRLYCQPSRFIRMLALPQFIINVIYARFKQKNRKKK